MVKWNFNQMKRGREWHVSPALNLSIVGSCLRYFLSSCSHGFGLTSGWMHNFNDSVSARRSRGGRKYFCRRASANVSNNLYRSMAEFLRGKAPLLAPGAFRFRKKVRSWQALQASDRQCGSESGHEFAAFYAHWIV